MSGTEKAEVLTKVASSGLPKRRALGDLEIWPESGVGRPAAILGVNKHSEG